MLSQRLAGIGAEIININTDGVAYCYPGEGDQIIFDEWQKEFGLTLESDFFEKWFQTNVNNYFAVTDGGYVVTKGGDVNKYHEPKYFANNDIRITHVALVDYLLKGVPVQDTLRKHLDDPTMYQYVLQAGHTYQGVVEASDPDTLLPTKINRVFAAKGEGIEILKKRQDDGLVKFADAPGNMFLWNGNVKEIPDFGKRVDLQWYYDLTMKMVKRWEVTD